MISMNESEIKKIETLLLDENFAEKIQDAGSYEEAYKLFNKNGVEVSLADFMGFVEESECLMKQNGMITENGELGPELLDAVSGGGKFAAICTWVVAGVAWAVCPPAGVALWLAGGCIWGSR